MATNKPPGDNARKGAVRKHSQLKTKIEGEKHWTKRSRDDGQFMAQKKDTHAISLRTTIPSLCSREELWRARGRGKLQAPTNGPGNR